MEQYTRLARHYDTLMTDAPYQRYADRLKPIFDKCRIPVKLVLDVACGTGALTRLLTKCGYEVIASDVSADMLSIARSSCADLKPQPLFLWQDMRELDLYGTVQAAVCSYDSLNYLQDMASVKKALSRVSLFLEPGGVFVFDVKSPEMFGEMAGLCSVHSEKNIFCAWQYGYDRHSGRAEHTVDIFEADGAKYIRTTESHFQRAFGRMQLETAVDEAGLRLKGVYQDLSVRKADGDTGRLLFVTEKR